MTLPIIKYRNVWFALSVGLVAASIGLLLSFGLRFGIDFTGGSLMELSFESRPDIQDVRNLFGESGYPEVTVQPVGDSEMLIRLPTLTEEAHQEAVVGLKGRFGEVEELRFESVGPTIGTEMSRKAVWSLLLVLVGIAAYVAFAFRKVSRPVASWKYGLITLIAALLHDVLIPLGVMAAIGHFFLVEINSSFIAAILTILGFSVHDTIVVFDRVRENLLKTSGAFEDIVERSVNETLARSVNTSVTTLFPLLAIAVFGGETIRWFAVTLIVGLIAGTYSSICLASPLLVVFQKRNRR
ncbi:protein translocase subunit SecF [Candidatus Uhrbacteria bacterium]|nr:protein translocase subunit SecF [Candidatus Uhrbacteria bacterium]